MRTELINWKLIFIFLLIVTFALFFFFPFYFMVSSSFKHPLDSSVYPPIIFNFEPTLKNHHIFNTKTGKSSNNFKAVSIISDKAWLSDALSTASLSMEVISLKNLCTKLEAKAYIQKDKHFTELA